MIEPREAAVGVSGGKDSIAALDICLRNLDRVEGFFWYYVPGLSFQEDQLRTIERQFHIRIVRLPDFHLPNFLRWGSFSSPGHRVNREFTRDLGFEDGLNASRRATNCQWIAMGIKSHDSPIRRIELHKPDVVRHPKLGALNEKLKRVYPAAWMTDKMVFSYLKTHRLPVSPEYRIMAAGDGRKNVATFGNFTPKALYQLKKGIPVSDWAKIVDVFPFIEALPAHYEMFGDKKRA